MTLNVLGRNAQPEVGLETWSSQARLISHTGAQYYATVSLPPSDLSIPSTRHPFANEQHLLEYVILPKGVETVEGWP